MNQPSGEKRASYKPTLVYSITGRLNVIVWRLPLPHRALGRLSMLVYRNPPVPSEVVVSIVRSLEQAGIRYWISGGWGVDAIAGRHTRVHRDLDLVIDDVEVERAAQALGAVGFFEWYRNDSDVPMFSRVVLHDHHIAGHAVDLHPLDVSSGHVEFATGSIDDHMVPCLSVESQIKTHSNYRKRWRDRADLATLRKALEGSTTALIVPVPIADDLCEESAREPGMPAHITVLHPFLRSRRVDYRTERALGQLLERLPAFDFVLSELGSFPKVIYLAPDPTQPFVALTEAVAMRWPEHQSYGGSFDEIVPHVTVAYADEPPPDLADRLPLHGRAEEVWLMSRIGYRWIRRRRFTLRGASGGP